MNVPATETLILLFPIAPCTLPYSQRASKSGMLSQWIHPKRYIWPVIVIEFTHEYYCSYRNKTYNLDDLVPDTESTALLWEHHWQYAMLLSLQTQQLHTTNVLFNDVWVTQVTFLLNLLFFYWLCYFIVLLFFKSNSNSNGDVEAFSWSKMSPFLRF